MTAAATILTLAFLLASSFVIGRALLVIASARELHGLEIALGLSLMLCVVVIGVRVPGHGTTAAVLLVLLAVAALWWARRDLTVPDLGALGAGAVAAIATALPFLAQGRFGILGVGLLDDVGSHYALADSLRLGIDIPLQGDLGSYPIAPHALIAGVVSLFGSDDPAAVTALMMTTSIGSAMVAATALRRAPIALRVLGGAAAGFGFLPAAYYGASSFKEILVGFLVLVFAVQLERIAETGAWRRGPVALLGLPVAAALGSFGAPGPAWMVGTVGAFLVLTAVAARRRPTREELRRVLVLGGGAVAVLLVASLPQIDRLVTFNAASNAVGGGDPKEFFGNLVGFLPLHEALGIWPGGDYRLPPTELSSSTVKVLAVLLGLALLAAIVVDLRRRRFALTSALAAALAIYFVNRQTQGPYVTGKTLVILAPLATTLTLRGLLALDGHVVVRRAGWALGAVAAALMLWSASLSLRSTPVQPLYQALDLRSFLPAIGDRPVLFIGYDNFVSWELAGAKVAMVAPYSVQPSVPINTRSNKPVGRFAPLDGDTLTPATLARAPLAITSGAGYGSRLAGEWRAIRQTSLYTLWERTSPTVPDKQILEEEGTTPGGRLDCKARSLPAGARALVLPDPVIGPANGWKGLDYAPATLDGAGNASGPAGATLQYTLDLAPGEWDLSLQYSGGADIRVSAPFLNRWMPANLLASGTTWPAGTLRSDGGPTTVFVTVENEPLLSRGTGASLGPLVATRRGGEREVAATAACGRFVDGYVVG